MSANNVFHQKADLTKSHRSGIKGQKPCVLWFTGLSGSGKSTIANIIDKELYAIGKHTYLLDGDNIRLGLTKDLGFSEGDRMENLRRVSEVAKLMVDAGLIVIAAFISPYKTDRHIARELFQEGEFIEVFVDVSLEIAEQRDIKGLYKQARAGEIKNFTGIDSPYERPEQPEVTLLNDKHTAEEMSKKLISFMEASGLIS